MASGPSNQDSSQPVVILYSSQGSAFGHKTQMLLAVRKIPYYTVPVSKIPPRPELENELGITYRKIPVLAINGMVYCDTFMIAQALEELYPDSEAHPSLYPKNQTTGKRENIAIQKLLVQFWTDRALFGVVMNLLPWKMFPKEFVDDRATYRGTPIQPDKLEESLPYTISQFKLHLELVEQQLDTHQTDYLFDTAYPGYLDISVYFLLSKLQQVGMKERIFSDREFPNMEKWMERVENYHERHQAGVEPKMITGEEANKLIPVPLPISYPSSSDSDLFGVGTEVDVVPDDLGKVPTRGTLVGIDRERILLDVRRRDGSGTTCRVCFPRLGFMILPGGGKSKA